MNPDFIFETGDSHAVCEDYGRQGMVGDVAYIIQSDGCSDPKSPDTDFGARLLAKAMENFVLADVRGVVARHAQVRAHLAVAQAASGARTIGLHPELHRRHADRGPGNPVREEGPSLNMWGDGVVSGKRRRDGGMRTGLR
jgi:hypothetical protein